MRHDVAAGSRASAWLVGTSRIVAPLAVEC